MSHGRFDVGARDDDEHEQQEQQEDGNVGKNLESTARQGTMLLQFGMHAAVVAWHVAQRVLHAWRGLDVLLYRLRLFFGSFLVFLVDDGLRLAGLLRCGSDFRLSLWLLKGDAEVSTAVGAETDALGQLLTAAVAEFGGGFGLAVIDDGVMPEGGIRVIANNKPAVFILAYGKALRAHDLAVVNQQLLLGYGHPFSALWALEFHILLLEVAAKVLLCVEKCK